MCVPLYFWQSCMPILIVMIHGLCDVQFLESLNQSVFRKFDFSWSDFVKLAPNALGKCAQKRSHNLEHFCNYIGIETTQSSLHHILVIAGDKIRSMWLKEREPPAPMLHLYLLALPFSFSTSFISPIFPLQRLSFFPFPLLKVFHFSHIQFSKSFISPISLF